MAPDSWHPITDVGDVIIQHFGPKLWVPSPVVRPNDLRGSPTKPTTTRLGAIEAARFVLLPGRRIYIHHHDDANWEAVE
jgi:hypothetical protein